MEIIDVDINVSIFEIICSISMLGKVFLSHVRAFCSIISMADSHCNNCCYTTFFSIFIKQINFIDLIDVNISNTLNNVHNFIQNISIRELNMYRYTFMNWLKNIMKKWSHIHSIHLSSSSVIINWNLGMKASLYNSTTNNVMRN